MFPYCGLETRNPENPYLTRDHIHTLQSVSDWVPPILWPMRLFPTSPARPGEPRLILRAQRKLVSPVSPPGRSGKMRPSEPPTTTLTLLHPGGASPGLCTAWGVSSTQGLARDGDTHAALPRWGPQHGHTSTFTGTHVRSFSSTYTPVRQIQRRSGCRVLCALNVNSAMTPGVV